MRELVAKLNLKAYQQGYHSGLHDLPWSAADWEAEFQPEYRRGRVDGQSARQIAGKEADHA